LLIALVLIGLFIAGVLQVNQMKVVEKIQQRLFSRYALEFTFKIPKLNLGSVQEYYLPELVNRFFDTVSLQKGLSKLLLDVPLAIIQILFGLILLSFYSSIFIIFGIILIVILYLVLYFTSQRGFDASIRESNFKYDIASWLQDVARSIISFKFHEKNNLHLKKTDNLVSGYLDARTEHFHVLKFQYWSLIVFKLLITASMLIVGGILLVEQQLNIGQFIAAEIVIITVLSAVEKMILSLDNVFDLLTSIEKLGKVADKQIENSGQLLIENNGTGLTISSKDLSFSYGGKKVLNDTTLEIKSNDKVCIVSDESVAKSTLINLLSGSLHEFEGKLAINNIPIANYSVDSLRKHIGIYVNNDEIFNASLWDNISMGRAGLLTDEMMLVLNQLGLMKFFTSLEKGFDTMLLTDGQGLGEQHIKKILLARAIVNKPSLLLLDNFDYAIHGEEKSRIYGVMMGMHNTTTIAVSNDPMFYMQCNRVIYVTNSGSRFFDSPIEFANFYKEVLK
jgi:ABC-type bacteriocin/lantibiotic exporter with double-glycine peptidase domain